MVQTTQRETEQAKEMKNYRWVIPKVESLRALGIRLLVCDSICRFARRQRGRVVSGLTDKGDGSGRLLTQGGRSAVQGR